MNRLASFILVLTIYLLSACQAGKENRHFKIGFSQCGETDAWRRAMIMEMKRELVFHPELELLYREAKDSSQLQIKQVKELLAEKIDLLIISPNEAEPLTPVVEEAFHKGISVIVVDRKIASTAYTNYIGANNFEIGKMAALYAAYTLNNKGNIIEIGGLPTSSPAIERSKGFAEGIRSFPRITITKTINGDWVRPRAKEALEAISPLLAGTDLIFAHNDIMAEGAYEVSRARGFNSIKIIGVDALPGKDAGLAFINNKILTASMLYPTGGTEAIRNAAKILANQDVGRETVLQTLVVDSSNIRMMSLQTEKIASQQNDIEQQQQMLETQKKLYYNQRTYIYVLVATLSMAILFGGFLFYSRMLNRRINRQLSQKSQEISQKNEQLIKLSQKAEVAHEAKLNFFTNISHEFRTPLTLILGSAEELEQTRNMPVAIRQTLNMIQKNGMRLLRLVNELMDFRKIEFNKMEVKASETDLILFINDILQSFQSLAKKKNIDLRLLTTERVLPVWIDPSLFDKALTNLLINSFKFTADGGYITVVAEKKYSENYAVIKVEDNGVGMTVQELDRVFSIFFQGQNRQYVGSGLGLPLTKELVELHHGNITVNSEPGNGTTFSIKLPLGKEHFTESELLPHTTDSVPPPTGNDKLIDDLFPAELYLADDAVKNEELQKTATILIIDDNEQMRQFLCRHLSPYYFIAEACNGIDGFSQVFEQSPDLIISDVMMPGKSGIILAEQLKKDVRTAHIPIILLTAKASIDQQIEGLKAKADAYVTKPFRLAYLQHTISNLLATRTALKDHLTLEIPLEIQTKPNKKTDRQFLADLTAIVEKNISNDAFSMEDICKELHLSKTQLYRKAKTLLHVNVNDYILNIRIQKAKYLLQQGNLTIAEIAYQAGFASSSYFSTAFKSKTGISPNAFKKNRGPVKEETKNNLA